MPSKISGPVDENNDDQVVPDLEQESLFPLDEESPLEDLDEYDEDEDDSRPILAEDLPPETQIWVDGPTAGQVVEWKKQHGGVYVTSITFDKHVAWRTLKRKEYANVIRHIEKVIAGGMSQVEANLLNEELVCQICCLAPKFEDFAEELAGLPSILSQQILESSGFTSWDIRGM